MYYILNFCILTRPPNHNVVKKENNNLGFSILVIIGHMKDVPPYSVWISFRFENHIKFLLHFYLNQQISVMDGNSMQGDKFSQQSFKREGLRINLARNENVGELLHTLKVHLTIQNMLAYDA